MAVTVTGSAVHFLFLYGMFSTFFSFSTTELAGSDQTKYSFIHEALKSDYAVFDESVQLDIQKDYSRRHKRTNDGAPPGGPSNNADETIEVMDHHDYYQSRYLSRGSEHWVDLDTTNRGTVVTHQTLSDRHLTAVNTDLSFKFPFYGHDLSSVVMATGGFLYMGTFMHKWLTATQYIAPLMGNFNPSLNDSSYIRYLDTGSSFTCEWSQLHLDDQVEVGSFTFQATLKKDGVIIFAYKNVPISLSLVGTTQHPVKVGLADAFYVDEKIYGNYYRRTIYEYHDVPLNKTYIKTDVAFIIEPLPTCNQLDTCDGCINSDIDFQCGWCHSVKRCSDGFDRHRQDWLAGGCDEKSGELLCTGESTSRNTGSGNTSLGVGGIIAIVAVIILLCSLAVFVIFAYMNPTSRPGLFLISLRYCFRKDTSASAADNSDKYAVTMDQDSRPIDTPPAQLPYPDSTEA